MIQLLLRALWVKGRCLGLKPTMLPAPRLVLDRGHCRGECIRCAHPVVFLHDGGDKDAARELPFEACELVQHRLQRPVADQLDVFPADHLQKNGAYELLCCILLCLVDLLLKEAT